MAVLPERKQTWLTRVMAVIGVLSLIVYSLPLMHSLWNPVYLIIGLLMAVGLFFYIRWLAGKVASMEKGHLFPITGLAMLLLWPALGYIAYPYMAKFAGSLDLSVLGYISIPFTSIMKKVLPENFLYLMWLGVSVTGLWLITALIMINNYLVKSAQKPTFIKSLLIGWMVFIGLGLWTTSIHPVTGDEPHYLLISHSIWHDGDIVLNNNMASKDFQAFYPADDLDFHYPSYKGQQMISKHLPFISFLLAPFYGLLGRFGAVLIIMLAAALIAQLLSMLARRWGCEQEEANLVWIMALFTVPLGIYFDLIFTELPAIALFLIGLLGYYKTSRYSHWLILLAAILLPWFYPKYIPLSLILGLLMIIQNWSDKKQLIKLSFVALLAGGLYFRFYQQFYGVAVEGNPYGTFHPTFSWRGLGNAMGLLIDRDFGMLASSPILFLSVTGLLALKNKKAALVTGAVVVTEFLLYMHFDDFTGSSAISSRHFLPATIMLLPFSIIGFNRWRKGEKWQRVAAWLLAAGSIIPVWLCSAGPVLRYLAPKIKLWHKLGFSPSPFPCIADGMTKAEMLWGSGWLILLLGLVIMTNRQALLNIFNNQNNKDGG